MKLDKSDKSEILENALSYSVIFAMFVYGFGKTMQFRDAVDISKTPSEMTGMELMWAFYGYSFSYGITIGIIQVVGGILMLINKTRLIGCGIVTILLINIILQDIYFAVNPGALKAAIFYQLIIIIILWLNRESIKQSFLFLLKKRIMYESKSKSFSIFILSFLLFIVLRIIEYYLTIKF